MIHHTRKRYKQYNKPCLSLLIRQINLAAKEQLEPWFLAINPQHTVPTLVDDGRALWDSHVISTYLIGKYGGADGDHPLYPRDLYTRARIDQRLLFDTTVVFPAIRDIVRNIFFARAYELTAEQIMVAHETYALLETFLATDEYLVGDQLTVADLAIISTVWALRSQVTPDAQQYPKFTAWIARMTELPHFNEAIAANVATFDVKLDAVIARNRAAAEEKKAEE